MADRSNKSNSSSDRKILQHIIDSHCHLTDDQRFFAYLDEKKLNVRGMCLCSATPLDWPLVTRAITQYSKPDLYGCFGVHPWHVNTVTATDQGWVNTLTELLVTHPKSIVGEIGIDKGKAEATFKDGTQIKIFEQQFNLASILRRPVNLHCVRAHGYLLEFLRKFSEDETKYFPPILCHSWTGSAEMVNCFLKLPKKAGKKIFFGFSGAINLNNSSKKLDASIELIPDDRIVVESDFDACAQQDEGVLSMLIRISQVKKWTYEVTADKTAKNFLEFFEGITGADKIVVAEKS